jgi:hypothetical protein
MNTNILIGSLERFAAIVPAVARDVSPEDARWKPADGAWSILEIVTHLADEEVEDFRTRVRLTLHDPTQPWPPIDPVAWAAERRYNEGDPRRVVERFVSERRDSVAWLRTLKAPDWSNAYSHPRFGPISAGQVLAAWAAHDALHLRQIAKRMFQMAQRDGGEFASDYAGEWRA